MKNQKGFVWLPILLVVLVLVIVGGCVYWYMYQNTTSQLPQNSPTTSATQQATKQNNTSQTQATANTVAQKPTCALTANKSGVRPGEPVTFTWTSTGADYAVDYSPDYKPAAAADKMSPNGNQAYSELDPIMEGSSFNYTLFFVGAGGYTSCTASVAMTGSTAVIYNDAGDIILAPNSQASSNSSDLLVQIGSLSAPPIPLTVTFGGVASTTLINPNTTGQSFIFTAPSQSIYLYYCGISNNQVWLTASKKPSHCISRVG